jgi:uncharacterized membrane protein (DUF2068 family)
LPTALSPHRRTALKGIALFEAVKGIAAIAASVGLLSLIHRDVRAMASALIGHFHLDPAAQYPQMLLVGASLLANGNLEQFTLLAWAYAAIRLTEGYGLWRGRVWAEWLAAVSGAVYIPIELQHLVHNCSVINGTVLACNVAIVTYMTLRLWQRKAVKKLPQRLI